MDARIALTSGMTLAFPGMTCHIVSEIGRGSNSLVYRAWYADSHQARERHEVLVKELFPLHAKGAIYRAADGRIVCDPEGRETYALHLESFESGNAAHLAMLGRQSDSVGANLNTFEFNGTLYTVLGFNSGRTLEDELTAPALALRPLAERMIRLLDALEAFHEEGLLHLDIAPDNIMLLGKGSRERVMLIDYNSCRPMDDRETGAGQMYSVKQGYTAPEIRGGRIRDVGPWSDLYSVAAVFFQGITGAAMTPFQMMRPQPPNVSACPCLSQAPETVKSWVNAVLRRGLSALPSRRYRSCGEMRDDLLELLDRVDGVGITHWALWEAGWRNVERMIRDNPAMAYLKDTGTLYPSNVEAGGGVESMTDRLEKLMSPEGENALLIAGGGMGKTTALLRSVFSQSRKYTPTRPAIAYVSLYGWRAGERNAILDRVLETLRFKPETRSFEDARKALYELLDQPLSAPGGPRPALLLMLDGLNEISGDTAPLMEEVARLSKLRGVRLLAASRTDEAALPFERLRLTELTEADVQDALSREGLLMPEAPEMRRLLRTPLMLSIFIQTSRAEERQVSVSTSGDLMRAYFRALLEKDLRDQPEGADARWQDEAALYLVLPALAQEMDRRRAALTDAQLLPTVERCYCLFGSKLMRRAFPRWIGRAGAIRGEAKNGEEWYGRIVHDILWKRMGLLLRDDQGRYQVFHQMIAAHLLELEAENRRTIHRMQWVRRSVTALAALMSVAVVCMVYFWGFAPRPYDEAIAAQVFDQAMDAYVTSGMECEDLISMMACATGTPEEYAVRLAAFDRRNNPQALSAEAAVAMLEQMLQTGNVMPWSGKPMDGGSCESLLRLPREIAASFVLVANRVSALLSNETSAAGLTPEYIESVSQLIVENAGIAARLYALACLPHMTGPYEATATRGGADLLIPTVARQQTETEGQSAEALLSDIDALRQERAELLQTLLGDDAALVLDAP